MMVSMYKEDVDRPARSPDPLSDLRPTPVFARDVHRLARSSTDRGSIM